MGLGLIPAFATLYLSGSTVIGLSNVMWIFFACNVLGPVSTYFLVPETKDKDADVTDFQEWEDANSALGGDVRRLR